MNLAAIIHARWEDATALNAVLPAERLFTGRIPRDTANPCARLSITGSLAGKRSDKAAERNVEIQIAHWVDQNDFSTGQDVQDKIEEAFDNYDALLEDSTLINLRHTSSFFLQEENVMPSHWQFVTQFSATVQKDRVL